MKSKTDYLFILAAIFMSFILYSCRDCGTCIEYENDGTVIGEHKFCGDDLEAAKAYPERYDCD